MPHIGIHGFMGQKDCVILPQLPARLGLRQGPARIAVLEKICISALLPISRPAHRANAGSARTGC
jgi:hypothetical protein